MPNVDLNKTVFISYRRDVSKYLARAIFIDLRNYGYDVFLDIETIDNGDWETFILNQIAARTHFLLILTPGTLERCIDSNDMVRREIEQAIKLKRNIVPVLVEEFKFNAVQKYLAGNLATLPQFNAVRLPDDYFDETMTRLRSRFLKKPIYSPTIQAISAMEEAQIEQVIEQAISEPPTAAELSAEQFTMRAYNRSKKADWDGAIADITKAIQLKPDYAIAYNNRGVSFRKKGELESAVADYTKAILLKPDYAIAYNNRGNTYVEKGKLDYAVKDYSEAILLKPDYAEAYYNRGVAYHNQNELKKAIADYSEAIRIQPDYASAIVNRAEIYFSLKQYSKALIDLSQANKLEANNKDIVATLGITHQVLGNLEQAQRLWAWLTKQDKRFKDAEWVRKELNWAEPLVEAARKLISELEV